MTPPMAQKRTEGTHGATGTSKAKFTGLQALRLQRSCRISGAEIRMALELNKAQEAGMVATQAVGGANIPNGPRTAGTAPSPATLPELGIQSQRASEWRKLACPFRVKHDTRPARNPD